MRNAVQARSPRRKRMVIKSKMELARNRFNLTRDEIELSLKEMMFTGSPPEPANVAPMVKRLTVQDRFAVEIRGEILW